MKKTKCLFFAVAALIALMGCNTDLGPEYTTLPKVESTNFTPAAIVAPNDKVKVSAFVTSRYGLQSIAIYYHVDDGTEKVQTAFQKLYSIKGETSKTIEGTIPAQPVGAKVTVQVVAMSYYNVAGLSPVYDYTVVEGPDPDPLPEPGE